MALSFLFLAGVLAYGAQEAVYSVALKDWERSRLPTEKVWLHALGSRGYGELTAPERVHKALRHLPTLMDSKGAVWISADSNWVVAFSDPSKTIPEQVFCRECRLEAGRWEPLGGGWSAFDQALDRIDRMSTQNLSKTAKKHVGFRDSREIQY